VKKTLTPNHFFAVQDGRRVPEMLHASLAGTLDPEVRAHEAAKLNLQLMTWRAAPDINLHAISRLHCLVLGCGTLGCEVARTLVAWGVQKLTLVDNGRVSFSNPVRQSLFTVEDCKDGGVFKAEAAAVALAQIAPKLDVEAVVMNIPMPGHPPVATELEQTLQVCSIISPSFDSL
jgi:ubiquitin-like modifier-activating enzyme ATG7